MAKKKSTASENQPAAKSSETTETAASSRDTTLLKPTNPENPIPNEIINPESTAAESAVLKPTNPENPIPNELVSSESESSDPASETIVLRPTNPENPIPETISPKPEHVSGDLSDGLYSDDAAFLERIRSVSLTSAEAFHEAQHFSSRCLDVSKHLKSGNAVLVSNLLTILKLMDCWNTEAVNGLFISDEKARDIAEKYCLNGLKKLQANPADFVLSLEAHAKSGRVVDKAFLDNICSILLNLITQKEGTMADNQMAMAHLCSLLDSQKVSRLLYDPSPEARISVIRFLASQPDIDINDLSIALILLKDRNDAVNQALLGLFEHHQTCPDMVIPALINIMPSSSSGFRQDIINIIKGYGDDAIDSIMNAIENLQTDIYSSAKDIIAQSPQRYTDVLLKTLVSVRTKEHVRERVSEILRTHRDSSRRPEIERFLNSVSGRMSVIPKWVPPETSERFQAKATEDKRIYERLLTDEEIASFASKADEQLLTKLLMDASDTVRINALNVIRFQKTASQALIGTILVWMKSSSPDLAGAALDTYLSLEPDLEKSTASIIESFAHCESDEVKKNFFNVILRHQSSIDALIRAFYQSPQRCAGFIKKFLRLGPNKETLKSILHGLDRTQTVACIDETLQSLLQIDFEFDNRQIRKALIEHASHPVSFGQHGFMVRLFSLKLLRKYMLEDSERDAESVSLLQAFYKEAKNAELKQFTKTLLKDLGEEIFDFDDEEDDFEDLRDEEED